MTTTVQQVLDRFADGLTEGDFAAALDARLTSEPQAGTTALTAAEREFLADQHITINASRVVTDAVHQAASDIIELAAASWTAPEAAALMRIDPSRIRHRISDRSLYAFKVGRQLRLPHWQLTADSPRAPLPGLRTILEGVADDMQPVELARFMETPQPELLLADTAVTPRDWLLAGLDPTAVRDILEDMYEW